MGPAGPCPSRINKLVGPSAILPPHPSPAGDWPLILPATPPHPFSPQDFQIWSSLVQNGPSVARIFLLNYFLESTCPPQRL